MKVETHIGGSDVVVWLGRDHYIDARRDVRKPDFRLIEVVRNGHVYLSEYVGLCDAPKKIVAYMRRFSL